MNGNLRGTLVLAVDDSPDALAMVHDALESSGMDVLVALEGKQALAIAERMKPDMILLDALMPVMDGFETCRQLKSNALLADPTRIHHDYPGPASTDYYFASSTQHPCLFPSR